MFMRAMHIVFIIRFLKTSGGITKSDIGKTMNIISAIIRTGVTNILNTLMLPVEIRKDEREVERRRVRIT